MDESRAFGQYRLIYDRARVGLGEDGIQIRSARDVFEAMAPLAAVELGEAVWVLPLDTQGRLVLNDAQMIGNGTLNSCLIHPRDIFRAAIEFNAHAIVVCHNHPSGDPAPSIEDHNVTTELAEAGRWIGIPLSDHIILGHGRFFSFFDEGLLPCR